MPFSYLISSPTCYLVDGSDVFIDGTESGVYCNVFRLFPAPFCMRGIAATGRVSKCKLYRTELASVSVCGKSGKDPADLHGHKNYNNVVQSEGSSIKCFL